MYGDVDVSGADHLRTRTSAKSGVGSGVGFRGGGFLPLEKGRVKDSGRM